MYKAASVFTVDLNNVRNKKSGARHICNEHRSSFQKTLRAVPL
jgi:hypothetical protein